MDDLLKSLDIDKSEWLEDIKHVDSSPASFMASVDECILVKEKVGNSKRDLTPKLNYICINVLVRVWNLINIYMEYVMQEVDFCLSLDRVHMVKMKNWVGIEGGKVRRNVPCVGMSVRM